MSSKRRLRRRSCERKVRYESQVAAWAGVRRTQRHSEFHKPMSPYRCKFCGGWHFGTKGRGPRHR